MPINQEVKCDICTVGSHSPKGWYMVHLTKTNRILMIQCFVAPTAEAFKYAMLCGENCVQKFVARNLATLTPKAGPTEEPRHVVPSEYRDAEVNDTPLNLEKCMRCACYSTHIIAGLCVDCAVDLQYTGIDTTSEDPNAER